MHFKSYALEILTALALFLQALIPAAIGSAISQAYKKGLSWGERLMQWVVGICVSWFVTGAVDSFWHPNDFMKQAIGFVVAMIAFEAAPNFIRSASDAVGKLPEWVSGWLPKKPGGK